MKSVALILALLSQWDPRDVVPEQERLRMRNRDGSCVQCSIAIAGIHHANANAEVLLFDSEFGPPVRGGSWSGRVAQFAKSRGLEIWQIEGDETIGWIEWALSTNRYVALSFNPYHFQTFKPRSACSRTDRRSMWLTTTGPRSSNKSTARRFSADTTAAAAGQ